MPNPFSGKLPPLPAMPGAKTLLFNLSSPEREQTITGALRSLGIAVRIVRPDEQGQTLGYLTGLPGSKAADTPFRAFYGEMIVMSMLTDKQLDNFLQFFRDSGTPPVRLKAIVTPTNAGWTAAQLYAMLKKEAKTVR